MPSEEKTSWGYAQSPHTTVLYVCDDVKMAVAPTPFHQAERPVAITSARGNLETWAEVVSVAVTFESCLNFALDSFQNSYSFQGILEGDRSCIRLFHYSRHQPHCPVPVHFIHSPQGEQYLQEQEATPQDRLIRVGPLRAALSQAT